MSFGLPGSTAMASLLRANTLGVLDQVRRPAACSHVLLVRRGEHVGGGALLDLLHEVLGAGEGVGQVEVGRRRCQRLLLGLERLGQRRRARRR